MTRVLELETVTGTSEHQGVCDVPQNLRLPALASAGGPAPSSPCPAGSGWPFTYVSGHERHVTLNDRAGQPLRGWRITSQTDLGALLGETPALVGGDPVVVVEISKQTTAKFLYEYQVLRLARAGGTSVRFAVDPASRAQWGDPPFTGVRVGPDGQLYQLRTSRTSGVDIARYSLPPAKAASPTPAPAPTPPIDHGGQPAPPVSPRVTVPAAQPATPAANPVAPDPATSRWLLPSLAALGASLLAGLSIWLLYRHRHPAALDRQQPSRAAR